MDTTEGATPTRAKASASSSQGNDVTNTAMVCLALLRARNTPDLGPYCEALPKGLAFVLEHVEKAPAEGFEALTASGPQVQTAHRHVPLHRAPLRGGARASAGHPCIPGRVAWASAAIMTILSERGCVLRSPLFAVDPS